MGHTLGHDNEQDWLGLGNARVLIAGAGGIGSACARAFLEVGSRVAISDVDPVHLQRSARRIGGDPIELVGDLSDRDAARDVVQRAADALGGLDVVIHAVGINIRKPILDVTSTEWIETMDVNLNSAFYLAQAAGASMVANSSGSIVLFSSVSSSLAHIDHGPYAASKGAMNQMMRVMAREWAPHGVTVNAVAPGYVETPLTQGHLDVDGNREKLTSQVPIGRLGTPEELTGAVLFLSSSRSRFITGHVLYVDGGRTLL